MELTEEQFSWRPHEKAKSAVDIVWHLAIQTCLEKPEKREKARAAPRKGFDQLQQSIRIACCCESCGKQ